MTIHLISDRFSHLISDFLIEYCIPFFSDQVLFKQTKQSADYQSHWDWNKLFSVGNEVKSNQKTVSADEFFVVLARENERNWFASFDTKNPSVGFLQTTGWEKYGLNKPKYAIAYHLVGLVAVMRFLGQEPNPLSFFHDKSRGCMFDFTGFKEEVIYKLKSAHICQHCIEKLAKNAKNKVKDLAYVIGLQAALEDIRKKLFEVDMLSFFGKTDYQIIIKENLSLVVRLEKGGELTVPIAKGRETALFMILLKYPQGLSYDDFKKPKFLNEYLDLYHKYFVSNCSKETLRKQSQAEMENGTFKSNLQAMICKMKGRLKDNFHAYPQILSQLQIQSKQGLIFVPVDRNYLANQNKDIELD